METGLAEPGRQAKLLGRAGECALLDGLLADVRASKSRCLVLQGEAGIGKTALLTYLVESASDMALFRAVGIESEMELAYAGLHQVCAPMFDRLSRVPTPQREALEMVFGLLGAGGASDRFMVGLAVLSLVSAVSEERPVLCVVDDAQWFDQSSALTLAFVARRLLAEPVGVVFAAREAGDLLRHLPSLQVGGLRVRDARALLSSTARFELDEEVRDRIVAETRGNPLALLELPRGLTAAQLADGFGLLAPDVLPGRVEKSFLAQVESLPGDTRRLVLLAAADPTGDPRLLWRAAAQLGITRSAADGAVALGLVTISDRVVFRHPLLRSALYRSTTATERGTIHLALAYATDQTVDPDRRAWHLAAAAMGPDARVAAELERSAARAQTRGGLAAASALLCRAVALTAEPARRADRALGAAEASLQAGSFEVAQELIGAADAGPYDEWRAARAALLKGQLSLFSAFGAADAPKLLLGAAQRLERLDVNLARDTYLDAWGAAYLARTPGAQGSRLEVSEAARSAPRPEDEPRPSDLLLDSLATLTIDGLAAAAPSLREVTRMFAGERVLTEASLRWGWLTVVPTYALWDEESTYAICVGQLRALREAGALARLPIDLNTFSLLAIRCGEFTSAEAAIAEADTVTGATEAGITPFTAMMLAAMRGREAEARALIDSVREQASATGQGVVLSVVEWMYALLCNGLGRYQEAVTAVQTANTDRAEEHFGSSAWATIELLEAATRVASQDLARTALDRIAAATTFAVTNSARGVLARSRALLSEGNTAENLYGEAIDQLSRTRLRPELARAHLVYGEWLRREGRRVDARKQLHTAHDMLAAIGMKAFAERAARELLATGEKARKRTVETRDDLTAQERQIAQAARDGLSNPEIGARLFLSPRTVEWHLRKVYGKLGIRSRHELTEALAGEESELTQA